MKRLGFISLSLIFLMLSCLARLAVAQTVIDDSKLIRPAQPPTPAAATPIFTVPGGTRILARLTSPLHSTSARAGSGIYLETEFPIVVNDRVVVPANSYVQGTVEEESRPGRVRGRAQFSFHFDSLILPNNHTVRIAAALQGLPGSTRNRSRHERGAIEPVDQIDADVYTVAKGTLAGGMLGGLGGRSGFGLGMGALAGGGLGLAKVLFTRGDEISLPVGTRVELVLERPVSIEAQYVQ